MHWKRTVASEKQSETTSYNNISGKSVTRTTINTTITTAAAAAAASITCKIGCADMPQTYSSDFERASLFHATI